MVNNSIKSIERTQINNHHIIMLIIHQYFTVFNITISGIEQNNSITKYQQLLIFDAINVVISVYQNPRYIYVYIYIFTFQLHNLNNLEPCKGTPDKMTYAVRDTSVSRHNWGTNLGPHLNPSIRQCCDGARGALNLSPMMPRETIVSRTAMLQIADVYLFWSNC